jgi:RHS repeat-associated protein
MTTMRTILRTSKRRLSGIGSLVLAVVVSSVSVATANATTTVTYYYSDMQGTPLVLADASGNIIATADFKPYGAQAAGSPTAGPGYTGHVFDADSLLIYMQARYYDPDAGRFLSVDPITPANGGVFRTNRFDYANGNPVTNIDPDGRNTNSDGRETDPCASAANVCAFDSHDSHDGAIASIGQNNGPSGGGKYEISHGVPDGAYFFASMDGAGFYAPGNYDFSAVYVAGVKDKDNIFGHASYDSIQKAIGQGGTYDVQRSQGVFYGAYTNASNFNVGIYMNGAGYTLYQTKAIGAVYSRRNSSNANSASQTQWWVRGWQSAQAKNFPHGRPAAASDFIFSNQGTH